MRCPLYFRKRTFSAMAAMGIKLSSRITCCQIYLPLRSLLPRFRFLSCYEPTQGYRQQNTCENSQPPDYIPALSRCAPSRLVKPHCLQECSRPRRGVVCPPTQTLHRPHGTDVLSLFRVVRRC